MIDFEAEQYINVGIKLIIIITRERFLRKIIVAVSIFQDCAIHPYS